MQTATTLDQPSREKHPTGLYILFGTEMWERFSFYGMKALLIYYMTSALLYSQAEASRVYGYYTGAVYFTPFFGGMLADRFLGQRRSVILGAIVMAIGEFMLMSKSLFMPALVLLVLGNGLFKPNISTQVGSLYPAGDTRRDRAFSIFYLGINIGASLAPIVAGTLGETVDFRFGFAAAGVGMLVGLVVYLLGQRHLAPDHTMAAANGTPKEPAKPLTAEDRRRILGLLGVCTLNIVFWAVYEQSSNTIALWARDFTDRHVFGWLPASWTVLASLREWDMPATWFQSVNPVLILVLTPAVATFWERQSRRGREPSSVVKMAIGCALLGLSFAVMYLGALTLGADGKASSLWLLVFFVLLTVGELYLSPIGLSTVTKIAPPRLVSTLMGVWFLSISVGDNASGFLGTLWSTMSKANFFLVLAGMGLAAGFAIFAVSRPLDRAMEKPVEGKPAESGAA